MNLKMYYKLLKQGENIEITADLSLQLDEAHNPEVVGSNPAPATNKT
jgi:hypothetical protein